MKNWVKYLLIGVIFFAGLSIGSGGVDLDQKKQISTNEIIDNNDDNNEEWIYDNIENNLFTTAAKKGEEALSKGFSFVFKGIENLFKKILGF